MPLLSHPSFGPRTALTYVTVGSLIDVWTLVWYFTRESQLTPTGQFWVIGLVFTGLTFITLGLLLGPLARWARQSELPPAEAMATEARIQKAAALNTPPVAAQPVAESTPVKVTG
jgi:RsiW-degrading membrane proteinase PrsW (M82 family)